MKCQFCNRDRYTHWILEPIGLESCVMCKECSMSFIQQFLNKKSTDCWKDYFIEDIEEDKC